MAYSLRVRPRIFVSALLVSIFVSGMLLLSPWGILGNARAQEPVDVSIIAPTTGLGTISVDPDVPFAMVVRIHAGPDAELDAAQIFINFDPLVLTVPGGVDGVTIELPTGWVPLADPVVDNAEGHIDVSVGNFFGSPLAALHDLIAVDFQAVGASPGSEISFSELGL